MEHIYKDHDEKDYCINEDMIRFGNNYSCTLNRSTEPPVVLAQCQKCLTMSPHQGASVSFSDST